VWQKVALQVATSKTGQKIIIGALVGIFMLPALLLSALNPFRDTPQQDPYQVALAELGVEKKVTKSVISSTTIKAVDLIIYEDISKRKVSDIKADIERYYLEVKIEEVERCEEQPQKDDALESVCFKEKEKVFSYKSDDEIFKSLQHERTLTDEQISDIKNMIALAKEAGIVDIARDGAPVTTTGGYILPTPHGRVSCRYACYEGHIGTDVAATPGTVIFAMQAGVVLATEGTCVEGERSCGGGYGNNIKIKHMVDGKSVVTVYGHMLTNSVQVQPGDTVEQGAHIGLVGNTGISTGAHVHVEILENIDYFPASKAERIQYAVDTEKVIAYPKEW
jgi:murein DD-endopeptidase MepM/ murein hydrolase activator NlpD